MPFKSKAQQKMMFAKHPKVAKRWAAETEDMEHLPKRSADDMGRKSMKSARTAKMAAAHKRRMMEH